MRLDYIKNEHTHTYIYIYIYIYIHAKWKGEKSIKATLWKSWDVFLVIIIRMLSALTWHCKISFLIRYFRESWNHTLKD